MKKKIAILSSALAPFFTASVALAQTPPAINVAPPERFGFKNLGNFISNTLQVAFAIGILVVLAMLVWGAFEWITSGGDKDSVGKARNRIINALIGLAVLAVAFALAKVAGQFLGFNLANIEIPTPNPSPSGL